MIGGEYVEATDNFLVAPFELDGHKWYSCEQYFQWAKFATSTDAYTIAHAQSIIECKSAGSAWQMGQSRIATLRSDWELVKANVMYRAVKAKFDQHPDFAARLAATEGPIRAAPSTADWQHVNSVILERVRDECRPPEKRVSNARYEALRTLTEPMPSTLPSTLR